MTDKPKRKRTPNPRRKFLLMIGLPILALIAGYVALKPQMDAWLATDPFTPPCHFEQDRLFATGYTTEISSINQGMYHSTEALNSRELWSTHNGIHWAPDGQYLVSYSKPDNAILYTSDREILHTFSNDKKYFEWLPNSRYLTYEQDKSRYVFDVELLEVARTAWDTDYHWSPDGQYQIFSFPLLEDGLSVQHWGVYGGGVKFEYIWDDGIRAHIKFIDWSSDSQYIYLSVDNAIMKYDIESDTLLQISSLPFTPITASISPDQNYILFKKNSGDTKLLDLENNNFIDIPDLGKNGYGLWHPNSFYLILVLDRGQPEREIYLYDIRNGSQRQLYPQRTDSFVLSETGRYLLYVSDFHIGRTIIGGDYYASSKYRLYDIETDSDVLLADFEYMNQVRWLYHDRHEYIVLQEALDGDWSKPLLTYIIDPDNLSKCKIGWTGYELEFQPQP